MSSTRPPGRKLLASTQRNGERECRAHTQLTLDPDLAAVELHELTTQREHDLRALDLLRRRPHLTELLEHRFLVLGGDADSGVADQDLHVSIPWRRAHVDPPAFRRELDRVRQQVEDDLAVFRSSP